MALPVFCFSRVCLVHIFRMLKSRPASKDLEPEFAST